MKTYEIYVKISAIDHFCNQLRLYGCIIKSTKIVFSKQGKVIYRMIIEAPEKFIDPKIWMAKG
jgi:hypothetical protein